MFFITNQYSITGIANVISLITLEKNFHVTYDSKASGGCFTCHTASGNLVFNRCERTGFPFIDLDDHSDDAALILVQTVRKNYEGFTREEVERAIEARKVQARTGHPSEKILRKEVSRKSARSLFRNVPITTTDISNSKRIFGPSLPCARGKWVRSKSTKVRPGYVSIPQELLNLHKYITLAADVMFVCGLPFLITLSRKIRFVTVQYVPHRSASELSDALKNVISVYSRAGFTAQTALMDGEFDKVKDKLLDTITVNICSKNEHVP